MANGRKENKPEEKNVLEYCYCPIKNDLFIDPVVNVLGQSYERVCIEEWLKIHDTDPNTNTKLPDKKLISNLTLKKFMQDILPLWPEFLEMKKMKKELEEIRLELKKTKELLEQEKNNNKNEDRKKTQFVTKLKKDLNHFDQEQKDYVLLNIISDGNELNSDLMCSVKLGLIDNIKFYLKKGADINFKSSEDHGRTPLMVAVDAHKNPGDYGKKLLSFLCNEVSLCLDAQDDNGDTALHIASRHSDSWTYYLLCSKGANRFILNKERKLPELLYSSSFHFQRLPVPVPLVVKLPKEHYLLEKP